MIVKCEGDYWSCQGDGPLRPIAVEGSTRKEASDAWAHVFGRQYEEEQRATHRSMAHMEKNREDYRMLAAEARSYKGSF